MSASRVCSINVDLDPLRCYHEIHGLEPARDELRDVILRRALPRFLELFEKRGIKATLFVVGSDLEHDENARASLAAAARAGHELGNHSFSHFYDMARLDRTTIREEIARADELIKAVAGRPVIGFRSPGYDLSPNLLGVLSTFDYQYDSSVFPSAPYYAAKAAVMGVMALFGRTSRSVLGDPRALAAPLGPYYPGKTPFTARAGLVEGSLIELPVTVSPWLRLPTIGTYLLTLPAFIRTRAVDSVRSQPFFNFELHGIDLIDAAEDGIAPELVAKQPDLRVSLAKKRAALEAVLDQLAPDYEFLKLHEVADRFEQHAHPFHV